MCRSRFGCAMGKPDCLCIRQPAGRLGNGAMNGKKIGSRATAMPSKPGMLDGANWYQG